MGAARRGYILIAVLWALALVGAVAAAYAFSTRTNVAQARAESERAQAYYAARGACIQSVKDLAAGVRRAEITQGAQRAARDPNIRIDEQTGGVQVGDLPTFPPEMAGAGGLLGAIAARMNEINSQRGPAGSGSGRDSVGGSDGGSGGGAGVAVADVPLDEVEDVGGPLISLGHGTMRFAGADIDVWLESESGKVNINAAPRAMLERLFVALGEEPAAARSLVDAIEQHRISLLPQTDGQRSAAPRREPLSPLAGREFRYIEELINVPEIDPSRLERLLGVLTVYGSGAVDPNYARVEVLRAVGVVDERPLRFILDMQAQGDRITGEALRQVMGTSAYERVRGWLTFGVPPAFTARTSATVGESTARYLIRVAPPVEGAGGARVVRLLESREDWL